VVGNRNSKIYHVNPGCPDFFKIAVKNRVHFKTKEEAEAAGYRAAKNCRP
jgi:deoxyribonuclease-1